MQGVKVMNHQPWWSRLTSARKAAGLSKAELARAVKKSAASVTDWEAGAVRELGADTLLSLSRVLRVSPWWLQYGIGEQALPASKVAEPSGIYSADAARLVALYGALTTGQRQRLIEQLQEQDEENQEVRTELCRCHQGGGRTDGKSPTGRP